MTDGRIIPTRKALMRWLEGFAVDMDRFTVHDDLSVSVAGDLNINLEDFEGGRLPVKFRTVSGTFNCAFSMLTTLDNGPDLMDNLYCNANRLRSLAIDGRPPNFSNPSMATIVCNENDMTDLRGSPRFVFRLSCNQCKGLESLEGAPDEVYDLSILGCPRLVTLAGMPLVRGMAAVDNRMKHDIEYQRYAMQGKIREL